MQSFRSLLKDFGTNCRNTVRIGDHANATFDRITLPTEVQRHAFELPTSPPTPRRNRIAKLNNG